LVNVINIEVERVIKFITFVKKLLLHKFM